MSADRDVHAQARLARQALAMDMLQRLRPALLHELRSPMQAILSALHMLRKSLEDAPAGDANGARDRYVEMIRQSVQQLIVVSDGLLPRETGTERETCNLASMTERTLKLLRDAAALDDVRFELAIDALDSGVTVVKDELQLALTSLLVGVLERTPSGSKLPVKIIAKDSALDWTLRVPSRAITRDTCNALITTEPSRADTPFGVASAIVAEQGGSVSCDPLDDESWSLRVRLPAAGATPGRRSSDAGERGGDALRR
jgi:hypothetical protein